MTIEQLKELFPNATFETHHQHPNGGGWVENTATVAKTAQVSWNALVFGGEHSTSPFCWQGPKHSVTLSAPGVVSVGCLEFRRDNLDFITEEGRKHGYSDAEIDLYRRIIEIALEESDRRWPIDQEADRG